MSCNGRPSHVGIGSRGAPERFTVKHLSDAVWASRRAASFGAHCGLSLRAQGELAIVTSELVTNAVKFAGGAEVSLACAQSPSAGVDVTVEDRGPGISDPALAVLDGYSEGAMISPDTNPRGRRGLGSGLAAVKRLSDELCISPREGGGARIIARKWCVRANR